MPWVLKNNDPPKKKNRKSLVAAPPDPIANAMGGFGVVAPDLTSKPVEQLLEEDYGIDLEQAREDEEARRVLRAALEAENVRRAIGPKRVAPPEIPPTVPELTEEGVSYEEVTPGFMRPVGEFTPERAAQITEEMREFLADNPEAVREITDIRDDLDRMRRRLPDERIPFTDRTVGEVASGVHRSLAESLLREARHEGRPNVTGQLGLPIDLPEGHRPAESALGRALFRIPENLTYRFARGAGIPAEELEDFDPGGWGSSLAVDAILSAPLAYTRFPFLARAALYGAENVGQSLAAPWEDEADIPARERALLSFATGAVGGPVLEKVIPGAIRGAGEAARLYVGQPLEQVARLGADYASRMVREAEVDSDLRVLRRALDVAERRAAEGSEEAAAAAEGIRARITRLATGAADETPEPRPPLDFTEEEWKAFLEGAVAQTKRALRAGAPDDPTSVQFPGGRTPTTARPEPGRLTRGLGRVHAAANRLSPEAGLAAAGVVGATVGGGRLFASRFAELGDERLDQEQASAEPSPVRERNNTLAASAALIGALIAGRRKVADLLPDELRSAIRVSRDMIEAGTPEAEQARTLHPQLEDAARLRGIDPDNPNQLLDTKEWRQARREQRAGHPYPDGNDEVARATLEYVRTRRPDAPELTRVRSIDEEHAKRVADWYENAKSDPNDPITRQGYQEFVQTLEEQGEMLRQMGYEMEPVLDDPYPSSFAMMRDLEDTKRIKVYAGETEHPILTPEQVVLFRWVHDVIGHGGHGNRFDPVGQENAYREHARLFSPLARRALATETRGQNLWSDYGPHLRRPDGSFPQRGDPDFPAPGRRPFAEQKAALMPEELASPTAGVPHADLEAFAARVADAHASLAGDRSLPAGVHSMRLGDLVGKPYHAVSIPGRSELVEGSATKQQIEGFIRANADLLADERHSLGVWRQQNRTVLEVMATVPDRAEAASLAARYGQDAFDLQDLSRVPGTGAAAMPPTPPGIVSEVSQALELPAPIVAARAAERGVAEAVAPLSLAVPALAAEAFGPDNDYNGYGAALAAVGVIGKPRAASRALRKFTPDRETYFLWRKTPWGGAGTTFEFETPKGDLTVDVIHPEGTDKLIVQWFGHPTRDMGKKVDVGEEGVRHILSQVVREFPDARTLVALRIGGAREGKPHAQQKITKDIGRLRDAGLLGAAGVLAAQAADENPEAAALAATLPFIGRPRFYSRLQVGIERGPAKTTGKKWLDLVRQNAHKAERRWTGIEDWLKERTNQQLTREEVLEAVGKRGLRIAEVVRSHDPRRGAAIDELSRQVERIENGIRQSFEEAGLAGDDIDLVLNLVRRALDYPAGVGDLALAVRGIASTSGLKDPEALASRARAAANQLSEAESLREAIRALKQGGPRHSGLVEPGGEGYREILLVLDDDPDLAVLRREHEQALDVLLRDPSTETAKRYTDAWTKLDERHGTASGFRRPEHYYEPNVVAHVRVNVRTLPNGERVLFIEEVQSDWAQAGRKFGFESDPMPELTPKRLEDGWYAVTSEGRPRGDRFESEAEVIEFIQSGAGRVPDTPFRETNEWIGLALKRFIDEAVDGGYDRIAWTTGALQTARYNKLEQVAAVKWTKGEGGNVELEILTKGKPDDGINEPEDPRVITRKVAEKSLRDYLGSDLAGRILGGGDKGELIDPKISVGGEGMRAFYDRIVPDWVRGYARKNGVELEVEPVVVGQRPVWEVATGSDVSRYRDEGHARYVLSGLREGGVEAEIRPATEPIEAHAVRISGGPGRKLVEEGFPILGMTGIAAGALAADEREDLDGIKVAALGILAGRKKAGKAIARAGDPVGSVISKIDMGGGVPSLDLKHRFEKAYTYYVDHLYPIKRATLDVARKVGERKPEFDAEMLARAAQGDHGYAAEVLKRGVHAPGTLVRWTRGLEEIYAELGERQNDLIAYRVAKRALELMDPSRPGGAMRTGYEGMEDKLRAVIQRLENDPLITRLHAEIKDYHKQWLKLLEEEGVLRSLTKEERAQGFKSMADLIESRGNQEYTPFLRSKKQAERLLGLGKGGKRLANLPGPVRRLVGSERPIIDPMESDIRMTFVYSTLVMRQRVANSLAEIAENVPDQQWIKRIRTPMKRVSFSKDQLRGQVDDDLLDAVEPEHLSVFSPKRTLQGDQVIAVNGPNGTKRYYRVEPMLYEALMGMSGYQVGAFVRFLSFPAKLLRTGVTIMPDFAMANFIRDALQTAITSDAKGSPPTALFRAVHDGLRGMAALMVAKNPGVLKRTAKAGAFGATIGALAPTESEDRVGGAVVGAAVAGGFGAGARLFSRAGRLTGRKGVTEGMKPEDIISLWRSSGGDHAAYLSMDRRAMRDAIREMKRQGKKFPFAATPVDAIRAIAHGARDLGETFENATRVGEFMAQLDKAGTADPMAATSGAVFSRDVSTDFKRHGASVVVEILRPMAAFWNARVQGLDKIRRQARVNPKRVFPTLMATVTAPSMALYALNTKLAESDPGQWDYWDRPMWERNMFWLVPLPEGGYLRIPKPFELGLFFGSLPERMVEAFDPRNPHRGGMAEIGKQAWENFASLLAETFLPIPTAATPWIENFVNFDLFTGRPIHPQYEAEELDERLKGRERSSEVAGRLSDLQGAMTDAASRRAPVLTSFAEWLQMSPAEIDNVLRDYTGSLGREAVRGADRLLRDTETRGKPPTPQRSQRPLTGRFFGDVPHPFGENINQFYDAKAEAEGAQATFDRLMEMGRIEQAEAFLEGKSGELGAADIGQDAARQLAQLRELRKLIEDSPDMTPDEKRAEIDEVNQMMSELAREVGSLMRELGQGQQQ